MKYSTSEILRILEGGSKQEKISIIESLWNSSDPEVINLVIERLDDSEIAVRGESFSSLILNENQITEHLIAALKHQSKNVRGFSSLILANRMELDSIKDIIKLTKDQSSMVRSCALGALGYMKANEAIESIYSCLDDPNLEVKRSAISAGIDIGDKNILQNIERFSDDEDSEIRKLVSEAITKFS
ncbi:MAG: HEAT repeat domain-containing protein [Nitrosopumilaceae archaeon]